MSRIYFAKFNVNEKIYRVYEKKESLSELLNNIYQSINTDIELFDSDGHYKFVQLDKNPESMIISGRIVLYAPGTHSSYDPEKDDIVEQKDERKATYITFCFDTIHEIIGFVPKRDFGRKQFLNKFKDLIEASTNIGEVELFLESDLEQLNSKLKKFKIVKEVSLNLIPPNGDKEEFEKLFGLKADDLSNTNGTKFFFKIGGSIRHGINISSEFIQRLIKGIVLGYGSISVTGRNTSDEDLTVSSDDDAPYTRPISNNNKDSIPQVTEKTRAGVVQLLSLKAKTRTDLNDGETQR